MKILHFIAEKPCSQISKKLFNFVAMSFWSQVLGQLPLLFVLIITVDSSLPAFGTSNNSPLLVHGNFILRGQVCYKNSRQTRYAFHCFLLDQPQNNQVSHCKLLHCPNLEKRTKRFQI